MKHEYRPQDNYYLTHNRNRRLLKRVVRFLAVVTVFCTTYALILPAITLETRTGGTVLETLDGDYAYIKNIELVTDRQAVLTGTAPWDDDDSAGNDTGSNNNIVRTFDTVSYTFQYETALRDIEQNKNIGGYKTGRVYFEFVLPLTKRQARFETDEMPWLKSASEIHYEYIPNTNVSIGGSVTQCQILRGSFMLTATSSNAAAIGASVNELSVTLRSMIMLNGETIQPRFTLWLDHNEVGTGYTDYIPESVVTGKGYADAKTFTPAIVTVSARPMYNIEIVGPSSLNTKLGTFNFNSALSGVDTNTLINYGIGSREGRLNGYGILVELRGKGNGQGLRGAEVPRNCTVEFDLKLSADFQPDGGTRQSATNYQPLLYAYDQNISDATTAKREIITQLPYCSEVPWSQMQNNWELGYMRCLDGGGWSFSQAYGDSSLTHVKVDYANVSVQGNDNTDTALYFPRTYSGGVSEYYTYYSKDCGYDTDQTKWWKIDRAVFSAGRAFVVQPFYSSDNNTYVCDAYSTGGGQFFTSVEVKDMQVNAFYSGAEPTPLTAAEVNPDDNIRNDGQRLINEGVIDGYVEYTKYNGAWNEPLSDGAFGNDKDWVTAGSEIMLQIEMGHDGAEGECVGVASDNLIKFDPAFFEPTAIVGSDGQPISLEEDQVSVLWGFKGNWPNYEMKQYTEDQLVYCGQYDLDTYKGYGWVPVAVLFETRKVLQESAQNHLHYYVKGRVKKDCQTNQVYMVTRNTYVWTKKDVAQYALDYYNSKPENASNRKTEKSQLTDDDYNDYAMNGLVTHRTWMTNNFGTIYTGTSGDVGSIADLNLDSNGNPIFNTNYPKPSWYEDYYSSEGCKTASKATYNQGLYSQGTGMHRFEDSCLVIDFKATVTKQVAQTVGTNPKAVYDMNQNQRTVDYKITAQIDRNVLTDGSSTASNVEAIIYVEDTLPDKLTYLTDSAYYGGTYTQDGTYQSQGTVTGGTQFTATSVEGDLTPTDTQPLIRLSADSEGKKTVLFAFKISIDPNATTWSQPIYFSCRIGTPDSDETDVVHNQQVDNTVKIYSNVVEFREFKAEYGNLSTVGFTVSKTEAISLSKTSDALVLENGDDMGFTMNVGNNSAVQKSGTVIAETLPYNGENNSRFSGTLTVEEFSVALVGTDDISKPISDGNFTFYYTTDTQYAGKLGADYKALLNGLNTTEQKKNYFSTNGWSSLDFAAGTSVVNGTELYSANNLPSEQITAIVAVGNLAANVTLKMHITLKTNDAKAGDYFVNYLSKDSLSSYGTSQIVSRSIEGYAWKDANSNGIQDEGEEPLNGVKVSLYRWDGTAYTKLTVSNSTKYVEAETGQSFNALYGTAETYQNGYYKFEDLKEGMYKVEFNGTVIESLIASPANCGEDDRLDSDGIPIYSSDRATLNKTTVEGIVLKPLNEITNSIDESKYNDSGFYDRGYELPRSGGKGTAPYTVTGIIICGLSCLAYLYLKASKAVRAEK